MNYGEKMANMNHDLSKEYIHSETDCLNYFSSCVKHKDVKLIGFEHEMILHDDLNNTHVKNHTDQRSS